MVNHSQAIQPIHHLTVFVSSENISDTLSAHFNLNNTVLLTTVTILTIQYYYSHLGSPDLIYPA